MNIIFLQKDYVNNDRSSVLGINSERAKTVQKKRTFFGGTNHSSEKCFKNIRQEKEKSCADGHSDNRQTERTSRKCFRCGYQDHITATFPEQPKDNEKWRKQGHFNEKGNHECKSSKNNRDQKIYASMACMSSNDECISGNFVVSS